MALVEDIKARTKEAMKAKDEVAKSILRLALGEIQLAESRGASLDEAGRQKIVRKLIASNEATLESTTDEAARARIETENRILSDLLPEQLTVEGIVELLEPVRPQIVGAPADGAAMGVAMKHLKASGAPVDGGDVREAVQRMRS
jgi:uncharacterized protein YqeY